MRTYLHILILLGCLNTKAQLPGKEAWHWYFGTSGIIDFNADTAISSFTQTSPLASWEGCASVSDPNTGQLILYTNGVFVCNASHHPMFDGVGLLGNQYSSQSALIVPKPGSTTLFYIISTDATTHYPNLGVHYSIADITYNNGQGKIIVKNKLLTPPPTAEKSTAVKHCNGTDYWIITHSYSSNAFNAYKVTSAGIDTIPVVSYAGTAIIDTLDPVQWDYGYLKASPNGKKLALGEGDTLKYLELFDFDNSTGVVSNPIKFTNTKGGIYGVSFSPDNSKLYATSYNVGSIYQYDLSSNIASTIIASQYIVADSITPYVPIGLYVYGAIGAMQMAPNGKIYIARANVDTLAVINNPNNIGAACNFNLSGFPLHPGSKSAYGLPNLIDANTVGINLNLPNVQPCTPFPFELNIGNNFTFYKWSTGDTSNSISINASGKYWVTIINQQGCKAYDTLIVQPPPASLTFVMPNIVTPNGDKVNDEIDFGTYSFATLQIEIYNRWGLKVFESSDPHCVWKPTANEVDGTYFANLKYQIDCGSGNQTKKTTNFITVVR